MNQYFVMDQVRREKINERMRCLQDLVPGCYKTMGMEGILDEIINYVQSLQNQVEFLSMKLSAASSYYDYNIDDEAMTAPQCLKCSAAKCGKRCPKCRQLMSNPRSCTVNIVLWNTIQLLFPDEVEERKKAASRNDETQSQSPDSRDRHHIRGSSSTRSVTRVSMIDQNRSIRRRVGPSQSEDAALALRLQREEFMDAFQEPRSSTMRDNYRPTRTIYIRTRDRFTT